MIAFPTDKNQLLQLDWAQIEPAVHELESRTIDHHNVDEWLAGWSDLSRVVAEIFSRLAVAVTVNTADADAEQQYNTFVDQVYPRALEADQRLKEKLLATGLEPQGFEMPLKRARAEVDLFRAENVPLISEEQKLIQEFNKIVGAQTVEWEGRELTVKQLNPVFQDTDRAQRERAWRVSMDRQLQDRETINALWQKLLALRLKLAANAGKRRADSRRADSPDYRAYRWQELMRFDYTPDDCKRFHEAILEVVVPAAQRLYARRAQQLGVDRLRPWDLAVDPLGRPPLKPYRDIDEMKGKASSIFHHVDPELGQYFDVMQREGLLDLDNRKNKAPGGYCTNYPVARRPFIFGNFVGLHDDVQTLLHEGGHAFHDFETAHLTYFQQTQMPMEFAEVASMGMELLALPYIEKSTGGYYAPPDANRARVEHLEEIILFWPYMAVVDAFQQWVYEHPDQAADPAACDQAWSREWDRFMVGQDWSGLEDEKVTGWHRKLHIHTFPLYYIEYGLAQLGAVQVWRNSLKDPSGAVASYRRALALGGTVPLPQLFQAAGARLAFDSPTLREAVELLEGEMGKLSA